MLSNDTARPRGLPARAWLRADISNVVANEEFRTRVESQALRHDRYLEGMGLVRIAPLGGRVGVGILRDAVAVETRRTDSVCPLPDGSVAILAVRVGHAGVETIARRLMETAREMAQDEHGIVLRFVAGAAAAGDRRLDPDELWNGCFEAFEMAKTVDRDLVVQDWS